MEKKAKAHLIVLIIAYVISFTVTIFSLGLLVITIFGMGVNGGGAHYLTPVVAFGFAPMMIPVLTAISLLIGRKHLPQFTLLAIVNLALIMMAAIPAAVAAFTIPDILSTYY